MTGTTKGVSARVVELVRLKIGSAFVRASDAAVARALGVSRVSVSRYLKGQSVMETDVLLHANRHLQLPADELVEFMLLLQAETVAPDNAWVADLIVEFLDRVAKYRPSILSPATNARIEQTARQHRSGRRKAGTGLAILALGFLGSIAPQGARAAVPQLPPSVYYGKSPRGGRRRSRALDPWRPSHLPRRHRPHRDRNPMAPALQPIIC